MLFPRLSALADAVWRTGPPAIESFGRALEGHLQRLEALGVEYRPLAGPHPWQAESANAPDYKADIERS